jgi:hypothetical protein
MAALKEAPFPFHLGSGALCFGDHSILAYCCDFNLRRSTLRERSSRTLFDAESKMASYAGH